MTRRPENVYANYHAHVYFDAATLARAQAICTRAGKLFGVAVGRVHQKNVGPHPRWSCQLTFDAKQFDDLIPWTGFPQKEISGNPLNLRKTPFRSPWARASP